jgi:hypothetical protein
MATIASSVPRGRTLRFRPVLVVAALCFTSAALYVWMRAGVAPQLHAPFAHMCGDLLQPEDWHCRLTESDFLVTFAGGSLLIGVGVAVPGVVLAAENGTFRGFDAAAGENAVPEVAWSDGPTSEELVVRITEASSTTAQVVAHSGSHSVFCAQTSAAGATYGEAGRMHVALARAACDSTPLTSDALRMLDVDGLCVGVEDAIVLCRSVQRLLRETLATPAPA